MDHNWMSALADCAGPYKVTQRAQKLGQLVDDIAAEACKSQHSQIARSLCIALGDIAMLQATLPASAHARQLQASHLAAHAKMYLRCALYHKTLYGPLDISIRLIPACHKVDSGHNIACI